MAKYTPEPIDPQTGYITDKDLNSMSDKLNSGETLRSIRTYYGITLPFMKNIQLCWDQWRQDEDLGLFADYYRFWILINPPESYGNEPVNGDLPWNDPKPVAKKMKKESIQKTAENLPYDY